MYIYTQLTRVLLWSATVKKPEGDGRTGSERTTVGSLRTSPSRPSISFQSIQHKYDFQIEIKRSTLPIRQPVPSANPSVRPHPRLISLFLSRHPYPPSLPRRPLRARGLVASSHRPPFSSNTRSAPLSHTQNQPSEKLFN